MIAAPAAEGDAVKRFVLWSGTDAWRAEAAGIELTTDGVRAGGTQLGVEPVPYRLDYELEAREQFITERLRVSARGDGWSRAIDLTHDGRGTWSCDASSEGVVGLPPPGGDVAPLAGALDCDLGLSPLTNLMPVRRHRLHEKPGELDFLMAWISVPDLGVHPYPQRYEHARVNPNGSVVRFVDRGLSPGFVSDLELDGDGLVLVYPGLARRVATRGEDHGLSAMADLATPMAIRVAATLRLADHIAHGRQTAAELARVASADADALDRVLRHLVTAGLLSRDDSGRHTLTARGDALRDEHPSGLRAMLDLEGAVGRADLSFVELLHSVRTGEAAFPVHFGRPFWDDLAADPARTRSFDRQMGVDVGADAPAILSAFDWGSLGHVVDVGGGNGSLLIAMLNEHQALRGTVVDRPATAETARATLNSAGLADRSEVVTGSFFDPLPRGAGGYVLSAIVHDWDDEAAGTILRRCAEAAGTEGAVFVVEKIGADGESIRTGMDLRMLAYFAGRERGVAEITSLAEASGLSVAGVHPAGALSIVELRRATVPRARPPG